MLITAFGQTRGGRDAGLITLENETVRCLITTYGGALVSLEVPDAEGRRRDIVLGFDSIKAYEEQNKYIGALIGRYANRIGGSGFTLDGKRYRLDPNEPPNHLHGGSGGFDKRVWDAYEIPDGVQLTLSSPDLEGGYPGNLGVSVSYRLEGKKLILQYEAVSDRDTICNLTNHSYFNLNGHGAGTAMGHMLKLYSREFTPVSGSSCITTGELLPVEGMPMDFRSFRRLGERIDSDYEQLVFGGGYDHNWVVEGMPGVLRPAAEVYSPESGIFMRVDTTMPGIQLYTGNYLDGCPAGKGGAVYGKRDALCLETQFYPDSPNKPGFPQPTLRRGEVWRQETVFSFDTVEQG